MNPPVAPKPPPTAALELSVVVLDVDYTLIRSVRTESATNPYPQHAHSPHVEGYFHFALKTEPRRSNSITAPPPHQHGHAQHTSTSNAHTSTTKSSHSKPRPRPKPHPKKHSKSRGNCKSQPPSPTKTTSTKPFFTDSRGHRHRVGATEHYHIYIRPGLKKLMSFLTYLQRTTSLRLAIASMARRDYVEAIISGLRAHCSERRFPALCGTITRLQWRENLSPMSTPTHRCYYNGPYALSKRMNLRFKSLARIAELLGIPGVTGKGDMLMVDDNIGYFDHEDRVSGQIYQIPGWDYSRRTGPQSDRELATLSSVIQAIVDKGSIRQYLCSRVYSVFRHEYLGQRLKQSIHLRKQMVNILVDSIGMELDEDTVVSAMWILDNILKFVGKEGKEKTSTSLCEYLEMLFGCVIVYKMYTYDVFPSAHFIKLSFMKNEFWAHIKECYFEFYVRLLHGTWADGYQNINPSPKSEGKKRKSAPIEVVQSEPEEIEGVVHDMAEEEVVINNRSIKRHSSLSESASASMSMSSNLELSEGDAPSTPIAIATTIDPSAIIATTRTRTNAIDITTDNNDNDRRERERETDGVHRTSSSEDIFLTVSASRRIEEQLKALVRSISESTFIRNRSPVCFVGQRLLASSRAHPLDKSVSKYYKLLKKLYRERGKRDL